MQPSGKIISITYTPVFMNEKPADHFARVSMQQVRLITDFGIEGDCKAGQHDRQVNIISVAAVASLREDGFKTRPGELGEQLVIDGIDIESLAVGTQLNIGSFARVKITALREPCTRFGNIQGKDPQLAVGCVGVLVRVVECGMIHVGDPVRVVEYAAV